MVSLQACPNTADTTGIGAPSPIIATASAPRRECIPQTSCGELDPRAGRVSGSREAIDDAPRTCRTGDDA